MRIDLATLASNVNAHDGVVDIVGAGVDTLTVSSTPVRGTLHLILRVVLHVSELGRPHNLHLLVNDEDGGEIGKADGAFNVARDPNLPRGWEQGVFLHADLTQIVFPKLGNYSVEVLIDDNHIRSLQLRVIERQ